MNDPNVTGVLDRLKLSDNSATMLISFATKACKGDVNDFCLPRRSTYRPRVAKKPNVSKHNFVEFTESPPKQIALHRDGKLKKDRFGNK